MLCAVCCVLCAVYCVLCAVCCVLCAVCSLPTLYIYTWVCVCVCVSFLDIVLQVGGRENFKIEWSGNRRRHDWESLLQGEEYNKLQKLRQM